MFQKFLKSGTSKLRVIHLNYRQCSNVKGKFEVQNSNIGGGGRKITNIPLNEPIPWLPDPVYTQFSDITSETQVTTLSNGLRVASESKFGNFFTVGVLLDSGSRYEVAYPSGLSHFLEKLAFGQTMNMGREEIMNAFENLGGICDCQSSRDTLIYAASAESMGLDKTVEILGEVVLRPTFNDAEMQDARTAISFDLEALLTRPEKDLTLMEMIHAAAYRDNTIGIPKICPPQNIMNIDSEVIFSYLRSHHTPERMVLAGVGVNHDELVRIAEKHFVDKKPIWEVDRSLGSKRTVEVDDSIAQYTGGIILEEMDLSDVSSGSAPLPELAHIVVGLESTSHQHTDFVTCCVLNMMMGGGGSFSAGGPGKGMYTRLYTNVLNKYHWIHNATALNHAYIDSGVFCIHASAHPTRLADLVDVIVKEFIMMSRDVENEEFERAKVQLQSMLLMNLESRPVVFEDIGRQVLSNGLRRQPEYFMDLIRKVSKDDVIRVASQIVRSKPSVAALGSLSKLPSLSVIESALLDKHPKNNRKSRFSLFR